MNSSNYYYNKTIVAKVSKLTIKVISYHEFISYHIISNHMLFIKRNDKVSET